MSDEIIITGSILSGITELPSDFLVDVPLEILEHEEKEDRERYKELYLKLNTDISLDSDDNNEEEISNENKPEYIDDIFLNLDDAQIIDFIIQNL